MPLNHPYQAFHFSQSELIVAIRLFEYGVDIEGMCFGFTHMLKDAILAEDEEPEEKLTQMSASHQFNLRLSFLLVLAKLVMDEVAGEYDFDYQKLNEEEFRHFVNNCAERFAEEKNDFLHHAQSLFSTSFQLAPDEVELLNEVNINAYLTGIVLYQQPYVYSFLFDPKERLIPQNSVASAKLVRSILLEKTGGSHQSGTFSGLYIENGEKYDLQNYFAKLHEYAIQNNCAFPITLALGNDHSILVVLDIRKPKPWQFFNVNHLRILDNKFCMPGQSYSDHLEVAERILPALGCQEKVSLTAEIYVPAQHAKRMEPTINAWRDSIQSLHNPREKGGLLDDHGVPWINSAIATGEQELVQILAQFYVQPTDPHSMVPTPLYAAIQYQQVNLVDQFLNLGMDPNIGSGKECTTPLIEAASFGFDDIVKRLLEDPRTNQDAQTTKNNAALHYAVHNKYYSVVKLLLEHPQKPANPNLINHENLTPLLIAMKQGDTRLMILLLDNGADPNMVVNGQTALEYGLALNSIPVIKTLLSHKNNSIEINQFNNAGETILYAAVKQGDGDVVKTLLNSRPVRADPNQANRDGTTALCYAVTIGNPEMTDILLKAGADPNQLVDGTPPLAYAVVNAFANHCNEDSLEIIRRLLTYGADYNFSLSAGHTVLDFARQSNLNKVLELFNATPMVQSRLPPNLFRQTPKSESWRRRSTLQTDTLNTTKKL